MKLQFDPNQTFQLDAVAAVTDSSTASHRARPNTPSSTWATGAALFAGQERTELGVGNRLLLADDKLRANTRAVQARNDIEIADPAAPLEAWELFDAGRQRCATLPAFLRRDGDRHRQDLRLPAHDLRAVAALRLPEVHHRGAERGHPRRRAQEHRDHRRALPRALQQPALRAFRLRRQEGQPPAPVRRQQHAADSGHQHRCLPQELHRHRGRAEEQRHLQGERQALRPPAHRVRAGDAARSSSSTSRRAWIRPTRRRRPSRRSTRSARCAIRRRTAIRTTSSIGSTRCGPSSCKLVKQIVVASATADGGANDAFVRVEQIDYKKGIKAKLRIHVQTAEGPKEKSVTVKNGADLFTLSNERASYADGFVVAEINAEPGNEYIRFNNGRVLRLGEEIGGMRDDVWRAQIKHTVKKHLEKELQLRGARHQGAQPVLHRPRRELPRLRRRRPAGQGQVRRGVRGSACRAGQGRALRGLDVAQAARWTSLHNGYFAQDKKGVLKDTRGDTQADDEVYNLIMKDKERLLSIDEPLRFIFSHSALREGWDNPNVFQICTLNETRSAMKKRQEIGRGLRLPVDQNGLRVFDESVNKLYVMANESYEDFARALQTEYEEDCGVTFGKVPLTALAKLTRVVDGEEQPIGRETRRSDPRRRWSSRRCSTPRTHPACV